MNKNQMSTAEENEGVDGTKGMGRGWIMTPGGWFSKNSTTDEILYQQEYNTDLTWNEQKANKRGRGEQGRERRWGSREGINKDEGTEIGLVKAARMITYYTYKNTTPT